MATTIIAHIPVNTTAERRVSCSDGYTYSIGRTTFRNRPLTEISRWKTGTGSDEVINWRNLPYEVRAFFKRAF